MLDPSPNLKSPESSSWSWEDGGLQVKIAVACVGLCLGLVFPLAREVLRNGFFSQKHCSQLSMFTVTI